MQDLVESFSGIRGIYGKGITEQLARQYALCYCQLFQSNTACLIVSGDSRPSTPALKRAMTRTFNDFGVKRIIDLGVVPIQVAEYSILKFKAQGGVYVSASHNEPEYNGWKFLKGDGALLYQQQIEKLIKAVHKAQGRNQLLGSRKSRTEIINKHQEAIANYIDFILKQLGKKAQEQIKNSKFKILADPNGGAAIVILEKIFKKLRIQAKIINNKLGEFNHLVEPNIESLAFLGKMIDAKDIEFSCGFDCDADRVELVLPSKFKFTKEMGPVVSGNYVLALACDSQLQGTKNQVVVTNDVTSCLIRDVVKKYGAKIKEVEVGEMILVEEMEKQKGLIGGEGSNGGVIIPPIKCRDGIKTIILILKMLAETRRSLADILESYPSYYSERTKMACPQDLAVEIKDGLEKYFRQKGYKIKKTGGRSGGLKALLNESNYVWFRQSKTEPGTFRIISDGNDKQKVKDLLKEGIFAFNKATKRK